MRLFVGLHPPDSIVQRIGAAIEALRPAAPGLRWSPVGNLHITTKFIGSWPDARLDEMSVALAQIRMRPFEVRVSGLGWFPNPHSPRIFWAGVKGGDALPMLASATDAATAALGIEKETQPYRPHLTLARVQQSSDIRQLRGAVADLAETDWGTFEARSFFLYLSKTTPAGSVYTKLAEVALVS